MVPAMEPLPPGFRWPDGVRAAAMFGFDLDAEAVMLADHPEVADYLDVIAHQRYGPRVAVPRLLRMLDRVGLRTTFFIPGWVAETWPDVARSVRDAGHEIGHHGYLHKRSDAISPFEQEEEIDKGIGALKERLGVTPKGYRSPSWELTPETFALLKHYGFSYDSSLMGDDRPYVYDGLLELPVHWSLDDWPHLHWKPGRGDAFTSPEAFLDTWLREFDSARRDRRHLTYTMHPEVIGRGYRAQLLDDLIMNMTARANVWFPAHEDVAAFGVG
jgi:peptidoglycan/xylan/chitin deacetylase (PgdA/CDA1 family)